MDYRQAVQDAYNGFAQGDRRPLFSIMDPGIEWTEAAGYPYGGTYIGPDAIEHGIFSRVEDEWDGYTATPDLILVDGPSVIVVGTYNGTYKATSKSFRARFAHVWHFTGENLVRFEQIVDSVKVMEALASL